MAMPKWLHDLLEESLKDKTHAVDGKETPVLDIVSTFYDGNEAMVKVQKANADISKERDGLRDQLKTLKTDLQKTVETKDEEIKRLQTNQLSDEDKQKLEAVKKQGMTAEAEAKYNALEDSLKTLNEKLEAQAKALADKEEAAKKALREKAHTDLRTELAQELGNQGITGENQRIALNDILGEGMAKLSDPDENGVMQRKYYIRKEGKILDAESPTALAEHYASVHETLVSSSGNGGSGKKHSPSDNKGGDWGKTLDQMQDNAASMMNEAAKGA